MLNSLIKTWLDGDRIAEPGDNKFSYSSGWKNISTAYGYNKANEEVRVDFRFAFRDVTKENLVDFIDYKWLLHNSGKQVSEYIMIYMGFFREKMAEDLVEEHFLIDKTCKKVRHIYLDISTDKQMSDFIKEYSLPDFNLMKTSSIGEIRNNDVSEEGNFGLRTKGIKKENLPGNPLISIIIPSFNSQKVIEQAIQSALVQSYQNIEIIIVDGGSRDSTAAIAKKYEDHIDWFNSEPDKNIFDAINKGTYLSTGMYSVFFGSDDLLVYNALEKVVESITSHGEKDFLYGNGIILTEDGHIRKRNCFIKGKKFSQFRIYHPALYIKRDVFVELNGFNIEHFISADADFELKLITGNKTFTKTENFLCIYRGGGHSSRFFGVKIKQVQTIYKNYGALDLSYYIGLIKMILLAGIRQIFGSRFLKLVSSVKNRIIRNR